MNAVILEIERASSNEVRALSVFHTGTIADSLGKTGQMLASMKPVYPGARLAGTAVTVRCVVADNLTIHKAIEVANAGDVLVVDAGGFPNAGYFGEIMSLAAKSKGLNGLVIDGGVRDITEISELGFPVFASAISPGGTVKKTLGTINCPIQCCGTAVNPGDIVIGDDDGVVVVPRESAAKVAGIALEMQKREGLYKKQIREGKTTMEIMGLDKLLSSWETSRQ